MEVRAERLPGVVSSHELGKRRLRVQGPQELGEFDHGGLILEQLGAGSFFHVTGLGRILEDRGHAARKQLPEGSHSALFRRTPALEGRDDPDGVAVRVVRVEHRREGELVGEASAILAVVGHVDDRVLCVSHGADHFGDGRGLAISALQKSAILARGFLGTVPRHGLESRVAERHGNARDLHVHDARGQVRELERPREGREPNALHVGGDLEGCSHGQVLELHTCRRREEGLLRTSFGASLCQGRLGCLRCPRGRVTVDDVRGTQHIVQSQGRLI
mmetsp:Transcript_22400/g.66059  ORF Transcript_22400/g.66059 Transcript_22400/m.66059 type:complete len:275 (+) Transcript_22400:1197-2021(+)